MRVVYFVLAALALLFVADRAIPAQLTALGLRAERSLSGLALRQAQVDGFSIPYLEGGSGEALLLLHGLAADKDNFTRTARLLTPHYRVIVPDLPGFGDSSPRRIDGDYTMDAQVRRMHGLLVQLGVKRVHLGGNSMGGFIAAQFAATYPDMVGSVWLLDPGGTAAALDTDIMREYERTGDNPLLAKRWQDFDKMLATTTHDTPFLPRFVRETLGRRAVDDLALHRKIMVQLREKSPLLETRWHKLATPALIVWGEQDLVLSPKAAASFQALFPHSKVILMKDIGHLPMVEAPRQTAADYLAFRAGLPP
jgi:triacylglycerol lipase